MLLSGSHGTQQLAEYFLNFEKVGFLLATLLMDGPPSLWSRTIAMSLQFGENLVENSC